MSRRALAIAAGALALAAGCSKGSAGPAFRLAQPSSVAIFQGYSEKHLDADGKLLLHPYAAVANTGQDELVLFDPVDNTVVAAPIVIRPTSIPLPQPRPAIVASASFTPPAAGIPRPDLLVVVAQASTELQLIRTWRNADQSDLANFIPDPSLVPDKAVDLGGEVVALVATPAVDASGSPVADRVRVIAALTGGRLAVVDYQWTGDPDTPENAGGGTVAPVSPTPTIQALGFDALALAVDASLDGRQEYTPPARPLLRNPRFLYAATPDPIPPTNVLGVAELDMAGDPPWTIRALNAHAPTLLVAAFTLQERQTGVQGAYDQFTAPTQGTADHTSFVDTAARRVYAYRDPASCGPTTSETCGIAVLDPATADVLEDPWHPGETPKRYLPPIPVPGRPVALVAGPPAWNPTAGDVVDESDPVPSPAPVPPEFHHRYMLMSMGTGVRLTTGVLFVPSEDGRSYFADLARWEIPSNSFEIDPLGSLTTVSAYRQSETDLPQIGFYQPQNVKDADAANGLQARPDWDPTIGARFFIELTPGFTPDDLWNVTYQGYLPAFATGRPAQITVDGVTAGQLRVTVQSSPGTEVVNVFDPALGVRVGDTVEVLTVGTGPNAKPSCPDTSVTNANGVLNAPIEGKISRIDRPDAAHPGGSLVVETADCVPIALLAGTTCDVAEHGPWTSMSGCWASLPGSGVQQVRIRAAGGGDPADPANLSGRSFVVVGAGTGYAGRATSAPVDGQMPFALANDDEALPCPLIPYPSNSNPAAIPDCDETCRSSCERAAIARRARRQYLTSVFCFKGSTESQDARNYCETYFPKFAKPQTSTRPPLGTFTGEPPTGPALAFSLGVQQPATRTADKLIVRDTQVIFTTASGRVPVARYGGGANNGPATGPMGAAWFDRSYDVSWDKQPDRYRFYVPHVGNLILDASPAHINSDTRVLR